MKAMIYILGTLVLLAGVIYGLMMIGVPQPILIVVALIIGGSGIMGAAKAHSGSRTVTKTTVDSEGNAETSETEIS
ncbi:MAG: hypothetical protein ACSHYF_09340 [Verrucomicrobiaceae bacterium]